MLNEFETKWNATKGLSYAECTRLGGRLFSYPRSRENIPNTGHERYILVNWRNIGGTSFVWAGALDILASAFQKHKVFYDKLDM